MNTFLLPRDPVTSLDAYLAGGTGGRGVAPAQDLGPADTIIEVAGFGLRGRSGDGFPTPVGGWVHHARGQDHAKEDSDG